MCWYFKFNEMVSLMTEIGDLLKNGVMPMTPAPENPLPVKKDQTTCPNCNKFYKGDLSGKFCTNCCASL